MSKQAGSMVEPLTGRSVVVTRSIADNALLCQRLRELGIEGVSVPLIEVQPPRGGFAPLTKKLERIEEYQWMVLTSANGAEAVALARPPQLLWPPQVRVAAIGPATGTAAKAAGLPVDMMPAVATAKNLVEAFPVGVEGGQDRVLAPLAELAGPTVEEGLRAKGYRVDRIDAYRTRAPSTTILQPTRLVVANADAVLFYSPSAVDRFVERFEPNDRPSLAICIGPSTATQAKPHDDWSVVIAEPHNEMGVISALTEQLSQT